jgi:hypothetical protein
LPRALAVSLGLVGIDLAHAFEQFLRIGFIDFWGAGPFAPAAATWGHGPVFLSLVWHTSNQIFSTQSLLLNTTSQKSAKTQAGDFLALNPSQK